MVCFVRLDNNVLRSFAQCGCVYLYGTKALFICGKTTGKLETQHRAKDGDNRVATGVLNFAHPNIGVIISLLSVTVRIKSCAVQTTFYTPTIWCMYYLDQTIFNSYDNYLHNICVTFCVLWGTLCVCVCVYVCFCISMGSWWRRGREKRMWPQATDKTVKPVYPCLSFSLFSSPWQNLNKISWPFKALAVTKPSHLLLIDYKCSAEELCPEKLQFRWCSTWMWV